MAEWPEVLEGGGAAPSIGGGPLPDDLVLARPPQVVAWGTVDGIPWQIEAFVTAPGPDARWWEHGPVGPELAFFLGRDQWLGGGGVGTRLNQGTHLTASVHFFGSLPHVVSWVGAVSEAVHRVDVVLDDGGVRPIPLHDGPAGFPRLFWFFPPRGALGRLIAFAADGTELQVEALMDLDVDPRSNAGTGVNAFGHPVGRPPPGWPDDPTEYGPGEGPRHAEDFHLHEATFPIYAMHPDRWDGYAALAGSGSSGRVVTEVRFGYFDEPGGSSRGMEIVNARPGGRPWMRSVRPQDVGIWWSDPLPDEDDVVNFASRFVPFEARPDLRGRSGFPDVGPARVPDIVRSEIVGGQVDVFRREFLRLPSLRSIGFALPETRVTLLGWELSFEELEAAARSIRRLELGTDLFRAMKDAQARSDRSFREVRGRDHEGGG